MTETILAVGGPLNQGGLDTQKRDADRKQKKALFVRFTDADSPPEEEEELRG